MPVPPASSRRLRVPPEAPVDRWRWTELRRTALRWLSVTVFGVPGVVMAVSGVATGTGRLVIGGATAVAATVCLVAGLRRPRSPVTGRTFRARLVELGLLVVGVALLVVAALSLHSR